VTRLRDAALTGLRKPRNQIRDNKPGPARQHAPTRGSAFAIPSPPLFPVHLRDLPKVVCHEVPRPPFDVGPFRIRTALVCHPGPTVGYRIEAAGASMVYLPDHEPALGLPNGRWPAPDWISGYDLAFNADLLIHDAQYTDEEYASCVGWGHSTYRHAFEFAAQVGAKRLVPFDHDPPHDDDMLDRLLEDSIRRFKSPCLAAAAAKAMTAKGPPALWSATKFSRICTRVALRGSWLNFNAAVLAGLIPILSKADSLGIPKSPAT
jgi:phosphoribosyl 1,2-cyclic phosphodiesterase